MPMSARLLETTSRGEEFHCQCGPRRRVSIVKLGAGEVTIPIVSKAWGGETISIVSEVLFLFGGTISIVMI